MAASARAVFALAALAAFAALGGAASGCDPIWRVEGVVVSGGAPVAGADVHSACATGSTAHMFDEHAVTDASGRFSLGKVGPTPNAPCTITITKDGYAPATTQTEKCPSGPVGCIRPVGSITLIPAPPPH